MEVRLFGAIAEKAGASTIQLDAPTVAELRQALIQRIPGLANLSHAIAVERRIVTGDHALSGTEEIAVLPPFAGG